MRAPEVVEASVASDSGGSATAYDRFARPVFTYRTPACDSGPLQAVAREQCLRFLRPKKGMPGLDKALGVTVDYPRGAGQAAPTGLHDLFEDAAAGLTRGEREVIDLQWRRGLDTAEVATVLGVSRARARRLLSQARDQLEGCLGVLLVSRAGRGECTGLGALLAGWDGRLTALLHARVRRHIRHCATCAARRARELRPGLLCGLSPGAALAAGAAESSRLEPGVPAGLRACTIALVSGHGPGAAANRAAVLGRTSGFGPRGFPRPDPARGPRAWLPASRRRRAAVAGAVAAAIATAVIALAVAGGSGPDPSAGHPKPPATLGTPLPGDSPPGCAATRPYAGNITFRLSRVTDNYGAGVKSTGYVSYMGDSEIVASIVAGDPAGLAAAYDRYASDLYGYCRSLLHESDDAADAVQDTFVIAASKLTGLREPERLRAWLFAVARNECLHRLKSRRVAAALQDIPEPVDDTVDVGGAAERAETVALVRAAAAGLNDGERDVLNQLWHGLEVPEVAAVLGVSRNHAYSLFSRARDQLEASVGVLLVGRAGRRDCAALDSLLGDWDGRLTARLRRRVGRHIDQCRVCSDRRRRELSPAMLYGLTPGTLLAMAAFRGFPAVAGTGQLASLLASIRDTVLRLVTEPGPHAAALRAGAGHGARAFGADGFPRTVHTGHLAFVPRPHLPLAVVSGTAVATAATATVVVTAVAPSPRIALVPQHSATATSAPLAGTAPLAGGGPGRGNAPGAPGAISRSGAPLVSAAATGAATLTQSGGASPGPGSGAGGASAPATGPASIATTPGTGPSSAGPASDPVSDAPTTTAAAPTGPASAPVTVTTGGAAAAGTLTLSASTMLVTPLLGGSVTLTASGGPVSWSISEPESLLGSLTVSPSSGTLDAGQSVTVSVSVVGLLSLDTQLTVEPDGQKVTVVIAVR